MLRFMLAFLLYFCASQAYADVAIKEHPLSRNSFKLKLRSYNDPKVPLVSHYPDVLIIHGLTYSSQQFDLNLRDYSVARALVKQGFRVWLLDITGYGESQKPTNGFVVDSNYAMEDIRAATDYIVRHQKVEKINLLGWSWGTITTSRFAANYPQHLNKLILLAPITHGLGIPRPESSYQIFSVEAAKSDFQLNAEGQIDNNIAEKDVVEAYLKQTEAFDAKGSPNGGRKDLSQSKIIQLLPYQRFTVPVLFIAGDRDTYLSAQRDFAILMRHAPEGSCEDIIPGAGHILLLEKPYYQRFQQDVITFLRYNSCVPHQ